MSCSRLATTAKLGTKMLKFWFTFLITPCYFAQHFRRKIFAGNAVVAKISCESRTINNAIKVPQWYAAQGSDTTMLNNAIFAGKKRKG